MNLYHLIKMKFTTDYQDCHPILLHPFSTFLKKSITHYRGYIQNDTPLCCRFRKNSPKNIISHHWLSQFPPCFVTPFFNFFSKIFVSLLLTITFLPRKGHTCSKNFSKKLHTADYHIFSAFCFCILEKKLKIFPSGNKELIAGYNQQQSSRTGILTPAVLREISIYYCYSTG